jgi:hypothetical protein
MIGQKPEQSVEQDCHPTYPRHSTSYRSLALTQKPQEDQLQTHQIALNFLMPNGRMLSQVEPSILMPSSADNSRPQTMISEKRNSETSKSLLERMNLPKRLQMEVTGPSHGTELLEPQYSRSHIVLKKSQVMENTSSPSSQQPTLPSTQESLRLTKPSGGESDLYEMQSYGTMKSLQISRLLTLTPSAYQLELEPHIVNPVTTRTRGREMSCVTSGTKTDVHKQRRSVDNNMSATCVGNQDIKGKTVNNTLSERVPKHPKFLCNFMWSGIINDDFFSPTACFTLTDPPLPRPLLDEFENVEVMEMI